MIRRSRIAVVAALAIAATPVTAIASSQTLTHRTTGPWQGKPEQQKPEPTKAPAAGVAGKWAVNIAGPSGAVESSLDLKADPKDAQKITGTIASQMGEAALTGTFVDGKLTFAFSMDANGQQLNVTFNGALQKDGSLAGTLSFGQGDLTWTATRAK